MILVTPDRAAPSPAIAGGHMEAAPSRTAMLAAVARGLLRLEATPPWVLDDTFALVLVGPAWQELRKGPVALFPTEVIREVLAGVT